MRHDVFSGGHAIHQRHHHVHRNHIGTQPGAQFSRGTAVTGLRDDFELGISRQRCGLRLRTVIESSAMRTRIIVIA
jgi:hypothetical protein